MMEALRSSETSVLTSATLRNISEDAILLSRDSNFFRNVVRGVHSQNIITAVQTQSFDEHGYLRMVSSGMIRRVALVKTEVSEELIASFIRG
jgi:hypothetical protein